MRKSFLAAALAALALSTGTLEAQQTKASSDVMATLEQNNAAFTKAMNAGDFAAVASLYTEDAVVLAANAPPVNGKAAITEFWNAMAGLNVSDVKLATKDVEVHGNVAIEVGSYSMKVKPAGAPAAMEDVGKYLVVWKKQKDGSWKIHRDSFSSDIPAAH